MSRKNYGLERGIDFYDENGDAPVVSSLFGAAAPGGDTGPQDDAGIGSTYRRTNGSFYRKTANAGSTADWIEMINADLTQLSFRSEIVRASTGEALVAGVRNLTTTPLTDDDGTTLVATDFTVGEYIISGIGGTPKLFEVTVVSTPNITLVEETVNPMADNDTFVSRNHLPDSPDDQEKQALLLYNGTDILKIGDFNWNLADGITLNGYVESQGPLAGTDTVQVAVEKTGGDVSDLVTLSGVARGALNLGTFPGSCIADNETVKGALEDLEGCIEALGTIGISQATGVTTEVTLDSVVVDDVIASEWEIHMREDANPTRVKVQKLFATHNGHSGADATTTDDTVFAKLKLGADFNAVAFAELNGAAASQVMRLRISSSTAGVTFTARRTDIPATP